MIIEEWRLITKEKEADIMVIDMRLLDTLMIWLFKFEIFSNR